MKGFSYSNLKYCKQFYLFYALDNSIRHQLVGELENHPIFQIPWGHHIQIFAKCKSVQEALFYVQKTIENGLLVCTGKDNVEVQYALENMNQPIGISEYNLSKLLPENFKSALPSIEDIEKHLREGD